MDPAQMHYLLRSFDMSVERRRFKIAGVDGTFAIEYDDDSIMFTTSIAIVNGDTMYPIKPEWKRKTEKCVSRTTLTNMLNRPERFHVEEVKRTSMDGHFSVTFLEQVNAYV